MIKKSPLASAVVALLAKGVSISKLEVGAPVPYLTILVIVAPASVLTKVVTAEPVASAVVRVIAPGVSEPKVTLEVPYEDGARPLITVDAESVATFELTVTLTR